MASLDGDSSIDGLLRSLTDRPNVESTLILSRKDGSIIQTAGFASNGKRPRALSTAVDNVNIQTNSTDDAATVEQEKITPAEELATSVFQFMKSAGLLAGTLATVSTEYDQEGAFFGQRSSNDASRSAIDVAADGQHNRPDAQVQLLRLRIRQREVIIYPDAQYICCVVQRIGKQPSTAGR